MRSEDLIAQGYTIKNAKITHADLTMEDHGCLTLSMTIEGNGWGCTYGGYCLGFGFVGSDTFRGSAEGLEYIMRIMDTVGVGKFSDLVGKHIRVATRRYGEVIKIFGNIIKEKWFDPEDVFNPQKEASE